MKYLSLFCLAIFLLSFPVAANAAAGAGLALEASNNIQKENAEKKKQEFIEGAVENSVYIAAAVESLQNYKKKHNDYPLSYKSWVHSSPGLSTALESTSGKFEYSYNPEKQIAELLYFDSSSDIQKKTSYEVLLGKTNIVSFLSYNGIYAAWNIQDFMTSDPNDRDAAIHQMDTSISYTSFYPTNITYNPDGTKTIDRSGSFILIAIIITAFIILIAGSIFMSIRLKKKGTSRLLKPS